MVGTDISGYSELGSPLVIDVREMILLIHISDEEVGILATTFKIDTLKTILHTYKLDL